MVSFRNRAIFAVFAVALLLLAVIPPAGAQVGFTPVVSGTLTAASASCLATNCVVMPVYAETGSVAWQLSGTFVATTQFEGTVNGVTWISIAVTPPNTAGLRVISTTAAGIWQANTAGFQSVRVRVSGYSSGSVGVAGKRSTATAPFGVAQ